MNNENALMVPDELIMNKILNIRGMKVMIDSDLAELYGVTTKRFNEQVKRNAKRFPVDFMFQLSEQEKQEVVANCDHLNRLKFSPVLPHAFTEHGAVMLASVLKMNYIFIPARSCSFQRLTQNWCKRKDSLSLRCRLPAPSLTLPHPGEGVFSLQFEVTTIHSNFAH